MAENNASQITSSVQASSKRTRPGTALVRSGATSSASNLHLNEIS